MCCDMFGMHGTHSCSSSRLAEACRYPLSKSRPEWNVKVSLTLLQRQRCDIVHETLACVRKRYGIGSKRLIGGGLMM